MNLEKLVKCLRKKYEKPLFILFSSDLHGAGKTTLSTLIYNKLKGEFKVELLSVGVVVREIAKSKGHDILSFRKNEDIMFDYYLDRGIVEKILKLKDSSHDFILVDSLLVHYYIDLITNFNVKILVYTPLDYSSKRSGINKIDLLSRSMIDLQRIERLLRIIHNKKEKDYIDNILFEGYNNYLQGNIKYDIIIVNIHTPEKVCHETIEKIIKKISEKFLS